MPDENLLKYIRDGLAMGRTEDVLRTLLARTGWAQSDLDAAFKMVHEGGSAAASPAAASSPSPTASVSQPSVQPAHPVSAAQPQSQPQPQPQSQPQISRVMASTGGPMQPSGKKAWAVGLAAGLVLVIGGGWAAYAYFIPPSPQHVLDAMFQKDFGDINSMDSQVVIGADLHLAPVSSSAPAAASSGGSPLGLASLMGGGDPLSALTQMISAQGPSQVGITLTASGTEIFAPQNEDDENVSTTIAISGQGQSMSFTVAGESRTVPGATYLNIASLPSVGLFDASAIEGKWIELPLPTSTLDAATLGAASSTLSAADRQTLATAAEGAIKIGKALPDGTIGGVRSYHYAYTIDQAGVDNLIDALAAIGKEQAGQASPSTASDASSTAQAKEQVNAFLGAFQGGLGGEIWIGKSDSYPHQITLNAAFSTSTQYGTVDGTIGVTTTIANINGGQTITAPADSESFGDLFASMIGQALQQSGGAGTSPSAVSTQAQGRDARRISDLRQIQNALQLYYDKCGAYPGGQVSSLCTPMTGRGFGAMELTILDSNMGITSLPNDPMAGKTYYYGANADGSGYILAATMENASNFVFSSYVPPSLAGYAVPGLVSCAAPTYCVSF